MKRGVGMVGLLAAVVPWAGLLSAALVLGGCASGPNADMGQQDIATESDESEARRRARIRMQLAVGYFEQGQTAVALDELKQVVAIDPTYPDAYNLRGLIHMRLNDFRQAEDSFKRAVSLNPRDGNTIHNLAWLYCQQRRFEDANQSFEQALSNRTYGDRAKTLMAQGLCLNRAGKKAEAEKSLSRAYELDAGNPIIGYNLASLMYDRGELQRSQFLMRRLNNSQLANAETLWLGVKVERKIGDRLAMNQLADQLKRRFPQSKEAGRLDRGAFDE
ncbi:type IV pilus biogenesis/stability protein PilW [Ramlibacter henchirensis]|uniref:Type IV pilus biogenesis/stability protein PilW n=1 Tax=Ramlibacter henchirensis TaxID=204072 RepID=A0A4Z0BN55_9BURK|nr:type IV pilus biogenesis/stability protein PilW [Ramlibacter henchirensis]TFZ00736.1 type IV pilus biogenesis/stability protein PilW [Ramlibacter henchirensis]